MDSLVLKLVLTPLLIVTATLVGRRWGPSVSGWLIGLPFTSGPVTFFLALDHGAAFATAAAAGTLVGTLSECVFCLTYAWVSRHQSWPLTLAASALAFGVATAGLQHVALPVLPAFVVVLAALLVSLRLMPNVPSEHKEAVTVPRWDLPVRAGVATAFVVVLTAVAPALGPRLTGLVAPFPLFASILALFAHQQQGSEAAVLVMRGLLVGLFGFASFFFVLAITLSSRGIALAFGLATLAALAVQGMTLVFVRAQRARPA